MTYYSSLKLTRSLTILGFLLSAPLSSSIAEEFKIGLIAPLSGAVQEHGTAVVAGFRLGLDAGHCADRVKLVVEDDGFDPKRTVGAARKLIDTDHVKILLTVGSGTSRAIAPFAKQAHIPLLSLAGDSSVGLNNPYVIRLRKPAGEEGTEIAHLLQKLKASRVGLLCSQNEFTLGVCSGISQELGSTVFHDEVTPETTDFRSQIVRMKALNVTHVVPILTPGKLGPFAKQAREMKLLAPFVGGTFFESTSDFLSANGALTGARYVMATLSKEFVEAYRHLSDVASGSIGWSAIFYDAARMLCGALESGSEVIGAFREVKDFPGAVGVLNFRSEAGDQYFHSPYVAKVLSHTGEGEVLTSEHSGE